MTARSPFEGEPQSLLLVRAQHALGDTQQSLGKRLGVSKRTMTRWQGGRTSPGKVALGRTAVLVHPKDPALAATLANAAGTTLELLGIAPPPAPPRPLPPAPPRRLADAVLCAAAEAMDVSPRAVRPALIAAFACARELGMSVEAFESALAPAAPAKRARG
jgi:hypothetical protein